MASKQPSPLIHVPARFSVVEPGVFRCASPTPAQIPFLSTLNLRTIVSLTVEHPIRPLLQYVRAHGVRFVHLGAALFQPLCDWRPIADEVVKAALEIVLDGRSHPVLIIDSMGIHQTGIVVGCLRAMQRWNFASNMAEYRAHSGPTKHHYKDETYIELFDPDLINLPPEEHLPGWWWGDGDWDDGWEEPDKERKEKKKPKDGKEGKGVKAPKEPKPDKPPKEAKPSKEGKEPAGDTEAMRAENGAGDARRRGDQ